MVYNINEVIQGTLVSRFFFFIGGGGLDSKCSSKTGAGSLIKMTYLKKNTVLVLITNLLGKTQEQKKNPKNCMFAFCLECFRSKINFNRTVSAHVSDFHFGICCMSLFNSLV